MSLMSGTRLGPYEILSTLGAGGMGEVYRAHDTKLNRYVAIKVLLPAVANDPDRLARFSREAQVLASLNHPNIAHIHGLEETGGVTALVLELVEGEDLAQRIARGAIPLDEALPIAKQIAEALEAAHEQGIIHRDLKPANIKVRPDGTVKVLDFGLAKAMEPPGGSSANAMNLPTLSMHATQAGIILGTAAYMSPEQAAGKAVDKRSDLWAFGVVLLEMLTGRQVFEGETVSHVLASVLKDEPSWTTLAANTPAPIRRLLRRCLEKDRKQRLPDAADIRLEIADALTAPEEPTAPAQAVLAERPRWRRAVPIAVAALVAAAVTSGAWGILRSSAPPPPIVSRFSVTLPEGQNFTNAGRQVLAIAPDGAQMVYVANQRLYLRAMSDLEARPIAGIDGSYSVLNPVFSPDGRSIAFWSGGDQSVKRISVTGGAAVTVAQVDAPSGMSWGVDGILIGQGGKGIVRVSPNGGKPETIVSVKSDEIAHGPQMLPDGQTILMTLTKGTGSDRWDKAQVVIQSLTSGERKTLIDGGADARYLPTGHLVYAFGGVVFAVPFDARRLQVSGGPVPMVEGVRRAGGSTGTAQFSTATNGSLVYVPGLVSAFNGLRELAFIDLKGAAAPFTLLPGSYDHPRVSPDGKRLAFGTDDGKDAVVWIYDLSGTTSMRRLTFGGRNRFPVWSADGQHVAFQSDREGDLGIFRQRADGTGTAERLTKPDKDTSHIPESWSPKSDGFLLRVTTGSTRTLAFFSLTSKKAEPFGGVQSSTPTNAVFSPDGRWVAYETDGARGFGARAVYVQPFPATGATYQVPLVEQGGYRNPLWSPDGKELFFLIGGNGSDTRLRVVGITTRPDFAFGNPVSLQKPAFWLDGNIDDARQYDVASDGQRFIARILAGAAGRADTGGQVASHIQVVLNWTEELKARVPTK